MVFTGCHRSQLWLFRETAWLAREQPRPLIPKVVLNDIQMFNHYPRLGPLLLVLLSLSFGLLHRLCDVVGLLCDVPAFDLNELVLEIG